MKKTKLWPVIILVAIVPFIMRGFIYEPNTMQQIIFQNTNELVDLYLFYKSALISVVGAIMFAYIALTIIKKKKDVVYLRSKKSG